MEELVFGSPVHQRQPVKRLAFPAPVLPAVCGAIVSSQPFLFEEGQLDTLFKSPQRMSPDSTSPRTRRHGSYACGGDLENMAAAKLSDVGPCDSPSE